MTKNWPIRHDYIPGGHNIKYPPLVQREKVILPPLHIKLGLMKNFVKALDKNGEAFNYLKALFPKISDAKLKEGIFVGPHFRKLLNDNIFEKRLNPQESPAWKSFVSVVEGFLGNHKTENCRQLIDTLLRNYKTMGCRMSLKIHFLHSHLDFLPENLEQ